MKLKFKEIKEKQFFLWNNKVMIKKSETKAMDVQHSHSFWDIWGEQLVELLHEKQSVTPNINQQPQGKTIE